MIAWLWNLFVGDLCIHRWKDIERVDIVNEQHAIIPTGTKWILQCQKCGNIKCTRT